MKELQGLGLKVDLVASDAVVDAESVLASNIHQEATHPATLDVPSPSISDIDMSEEDVVDDEFLLEEDGLSIQTTDDADAVLVATDDTTNEEEEAK